MGDHESIYTYGASTTRWRGRKHRAVGIQKARGQAGRFLVGCDSPIDLQAVALVGERSCRRGGHIQRMRLLVESDGFRLRGHYCHSGGLWMLQIGSAGASRHEREAAINWARASGGAAE